MQELVGKKLINHITNKIKTIARVDDNNIYLTLSSLSPKVNRILEAEVLSPGIIIVSAVNRGS